MRRLLFISALMAAMLVGITGLGAYWYSHHSEKFYPALQNGGFEAGLKHWRENLALSKKRGLVEISRVGVKEGQQALRLSSADQQTLASVISDPVALSGQRTFMLRAWVKVEGEPERIEIRVRPLDKRGASLGHYLRYNWQFVEIPANPGWQLLERPVSIHPEASAYDLTPSVIGPGTVILDSLEMQPLEPYRVPSQAYRLSQATNPVLWVESPLVKVYPDSIPPEKSGDSISLEGARGEYVAVQLVVWPHTQMGPIAVRFEEQRGPAVLPGDCFRARYVGYVEVKESLAFAGRTGLIPDPLLPQPPARVQANRPQPIWISVRIPPGAKAGDYHGNILLQNHSHPPIKLPLKLRVFDFQLPDKPALTTLARIWEYHPGDYDLFMQNLREHRISATNYRDLGALPVRVQPDGSIHLDWAAWDQAADHYFKQLNFREFSIPHIMLGDVQGFYKKDRKWFGLEIGQEKFCQAFADYARQVADHLREKGWLENALWQLWDEPTKPEMQETVRSLAGVIHQVAPGARIYTTMSFTERLLGAVNIWSLGLYLYDENRGAARRQAGDSIWCVPSDLFSLEPDNSSMALRLLPWRLRQFDFHGVEWWAISHWASDPYKCPVQSNRQNGGGFFLYPNPAGQGPPVDSIRWESYLEGLEDYDYLELLAAAQEKARKTLNIQDNRFTGEALVKSLTRLVVENFNKATDDPRQLQKARSIAARLILFLQASPPVVIHLGPTGKNEATLEGFVPPDARVFRNAGPLALGGDGHFVLAYAPGDQLVVRKDGTAKSLHLADLWEK